jgi:galactose mutarotase-like enzyme
MITIGNGIWHARVAETGAELKGLTFLPTGQEYIWRGDPSWWSGSAPVLFPVIGGLKGGRYTWQDRSYALPSHGFARTSQFTVIHSTEDSAVLHLSSSAATREQYPFDFALTVSFQLERAGISVRYEVSNAGTCRLYFSIGSHPAFVVPFAGGVLENYYVLFEKEETLERHFLTDGVMDATRTETALENSRVLSFTRGTFERGAMVFRNPLSREFSIRNSLNSHSIRLETEGVPYLGIWTKPGGAPFLCIEPWHGLPDRSDTTGRFEEKEGILTLEPGSLFTTGYRIEIT